MTKAKKPKRAGRHSGDGKAYIKYLVTARADKEPSDLVAFPFKHGMEAVLIAAGRA